MNWSDIPLPSIRREVHFDGRVVPCFAGRPSNVDSMLRTAGALNPAGEALIDGDKRISFAELDAMVSAVAAGLSDRGLKQGDRLALLVGNCWEFVVALLGGIRAGLIVVPIGVRAQAREIAYVLNDCAAAGVIYDAEFAGRLPAAGQAPALRICRGGRADGLSFDDLLRAGPDVPDAEMKQEDVAVILYTSGTTGDPKGAMLTHLNIVHSCQHYALCFRLTPADRSLMPVPASHVTGLIAGILAPLSVGAAMIVMDKFKASAFLRLAARERMTFTVMVPAMYNLCLLRAELEQYDLSHWRIGAFGGAPMPEATINTLAEKLPNLILAQAYGATETTSPATLMPLGHTAAHLDSVGKVVPCGEIRVMDDDGREVSFGETGEIWIAGAMVVPGYWNKPDKTAESFIGGFWRSGDIGSIDSDGYVRVFDRKKDMINRGGYKVFSTEVENVLSFHPDVAEVAIVPHPDPVLGEKVHAFIHPKNEVVDEVALRVFCAERLSDYKVPDFFTFCTEPLPRNTNGKLMKRELRDLVAKKLTT